MRAGSLAALLFGAALTLTACDLVALDGPPRTAGLDRVVRLDGREMVLLVAPADGSGMRGRTGFGRAGGMLFDLGGPVDPGSIGFVMDGVLVPLDIAWFDESGRLVGTDSMARCPAAPCPAHRPDAAFRWAIEAPPGTFDDLAAGALLQFAD